MEVSLPFRVVLLFHSIFFIGFLINTNLSTLVAVNLTPFFFLFHFCPFRALAVFIPQTLRTDGHRVCRLKRSADV